MGIHLNLYCSFKPKRKVPASWIAKLEEIGCYNNVYQNDDGTITIDAADVGGDGSDLLNEFIGKYARDYVIVSGDCDEGAFEELVTPNGMDEKQAQVRWRKAKIAELQKEIDALEKR